MVLLGGLGSRCLGCDLQGLGWWQASALALCRAAAHAPGQQSKAEACLGCVSCLAAFGNVAFVGREGEPQLQYFLGDSVNGLCGWCCMSVADEWAKDGQFGVGRSYQSVEFAFGNW